MKCILSVVLLFGLVCAFTDKEYESAFTNWMQDNRKSYSSSEFAIRFNIFRDNMDFVHQWNSQSGRHTVGLNKFADLSNEEYQEIYLMKNKIDASDRLAAAKKINNVIKYKNVGDDALNWADKGAVTPIKDQGQCGSCWSFSTTGAIEGATQIETGTLNSLSEQNLIDCDINNGDDGCNGGEPTTAMQYVINNNGIDLEDSYPAYSASQGSCRFQSSWVGASITGFTQVQAGSEDDLLSKTNMQPVSVAIDASQQSFQLYTSGVYSESNCSTTNLDHAVLVVGYGTDGNGTDYWVVKNSWGTSWGMSGYIDMSRNADNQCGIASDAAIATGASVPSSGSATGNTATSGSSGSSGQTSSGSSSSSGNTSN